MQKCITGLTSVNTSVAQRASDIKRHTREKKKMFATQPSLPWRAARMMIRRIHIVFNKHYGCNHAPQLESNLCPHKNQTRVMAIACDSVPSLFMQK